MSSYGSLGYKDGHVHVAARMFLGTRYQYSLYDHLCIM
jgi:hypothetical protein